MKKLMTFESFSNSENWFWPGEELQNALPNNIEVLPVEDEFSMNQEKNYVRGFSTKGMVTPSPTHRKRGTFELHKDGDFYGYITIDSNKTVKDPGLDGCEIYFYEGGILDDENKVEVSLDELSNL